MNSTTLAQPPFETTPLAAVGEIAVWVLLFAAAQVLIMIVTEVYRNHEERGMSITASVLRAVPYVIIGGPVRFHRRRMALVRADERAQELRTARRSGARVTPLRLIHGGRTDHAA
jgi:hypothetical protein